MFMSNRFYVFMLAMLFAEFAHGQQWGSSRVIHNRSIYSVFIRNPQNITISGGNDYNASLESVFNATDFGLNWNESTADTFGFCVRSIAFADPQHGFGSGFFGNYVHTTDGGLTWPRDTLPVNRNFFKAVYSSSTNAYLAGGEELNSNVQTILKSTDGAHTWAVVRDTAGPVLRSIAFMDTLRGCAVGDTGTILRTADGGLTWQAVTSPVQLNFNSITFINADTGYIVGGNRALDSSRVVLRTANGGISWAVIQNLPGAWLTDVWFMNADTGYIVGDLATFLETTDGGQTWTAQSVTNATGAEYFTSVRFYNAGFGVIGSLFGQVFVYANPPVPLVKTGSAVIQYLNQQQVVNVSGSTNTHGSPANMSFIVGHDSLLTGAIETLFPIEVTSNSFVSELFDIGAMHPSPGTHYFACKVTNTSGSYYGDTVKFIVPADTAVLIATGTTNGGTTSITLNGQVGNLPVGANVYFEYSFLGETNVHTVAATPPVINDTLAHNVAANVTGIIPNMQYQFRVKAIADSDIFYSGLLAFSLSAPIAIVNTQPATNITSTSATLQGVVSGLQLPASVWFQYILSGDTTMVAAVPPNINDVLSHNVQAQVTGLLTDSVYQYRVIVLLDSDYTYYGNFLTFFASPLSNGNIVVSTSVPVNVTTSSATLQGAVSNLPLQATVWFEYVFNGVTTTVPGVPAVVNDTLSHNVSAQLSGLTPYAQYVYRIKVLLNNGVTIYGDYFTFYAFSAGNIILIADSSNNATLGGANVFGHVGNLHFPAHVFFSYWTGASPVVTVPAMPGYINDTLTYAVTAQLGGLVPYSRYYCNVVVTDSPFIYQSSDTLQFLTGVRRVTTLPATNVTTTSAVLNGVGDSLPIPGSVYFQYWVSGSAATIIPGNPATIQDALPHNISAPVTGLVPDNIYQFRLKFVDTTGAVSYGDTLQVYTGASEIPNWDFQLWSYDTIPMPYGWLITTDHFKRVTGHSGNYGIEVSGQNIISLGQFAPNGNTLDFVNGRPYNYRPDSIVAWVKYNLAPGDSGGFIYSLHNQGNVVAQQWCFLGGNTGGVYKRVAFKVDYSSGLTPDSFMMAIIVPGKYDSISFDDFGFTPAAAPPIFNGNFETWFNYPIHNLLYWDYLRFLVFDSVPGYSFDAVSQTYFNPPYDYAAQIQNVFPALGGSIPGAIGTSEGYLGPPGPSFAVNARHVTLNGFYKYYPVNGDTALFTVAMYKAGQICGEGAFYAPDSVTEFTPFSIPINYYLSTDIPDSGSVGFSCFTNGLRGPSKLVLDKLHFDGFIAGLDETNGNNTVIDKGGIKIYPNPATSLLHVELTGFDEVPMTFEIHDISGRLLSTNRCEPGTQNTTINVAQLPAGIYLLTAINSGQVTTAKFVKY